MKETNKLMILKRNESKGIFCQFLTKLEIRKQKITRTIATVMTFLSVFILPVYVDDTRCQLQILLTLE